VRQNVGVVIATRDRAEDLVATLGRLRALPERPPIVVADNASSDGTAEAVRRHFPDVRVLELPVNLGAAARNLAACTLATPYVAFNDDDSDWAPGALTRAAAHFDARPRLGLLAGRVLVGRERRLDPTCATMAASPLASRPGAPGPAVLGFVACGAVVRREAFLAAGGFEARFGIGGEETLLAVDLAAAGWELAYVADVVTHHHPAGGGTRPGRRVREVRNALWSDWLRRPARPALRGTARAVRRAAGDQDAARGVAEALRGLPWALRERRRVPADVAASMAALDGG
jgi:GT2 family glycosyltransferase